MTTTTAVTPPQSPRKLPPVLGGLLSGTFWLALRTPLQTVFSLWTIPLILQLVNRDSNILGAYAFAWGFGFFQFLFEFGMSSALQRQVSETWTKGDRAGVDRAIACGMNFYAVMALVQIAALLFVAYVALPYTNYRGESYQLIVKLLWLQACTAPCFGISVVVSSVLQAARRYDFTPRFDLAVIILRFAVLWAGVKARGDLFTIVVIQTLVQISLTLVPAVWVMVRELGHWPHFRGARRDDYRALMHISFYMCLIQISLVLADRVDKTILGFALEAPGPATAVYEVVSKPFTQVRQTGWMLAYLVMPAVASLIGARDERSLERVKYDGTRLHIGLLIPLGTLAWIYAAPFLTLWMGNDLGYDAGRVAPLLRLFLVAAVPVLVSVPAQMAIGMNRIEVIAICALTGSLVNLPLSYYLTVKLGVSGVIWGTVLTTLFSNFLVPGVYIFHVVGIKPRVFLRRTLGAPACGLAVLLGATFAMQAVMPLHPSPAGGMSLVRWLPLVIHLAVASAAYACGYLAVPIGRTDLVEIVGKFRRRGQG